ncbi:Glycosyl transferase, family 2 [Calothrix sp. PCC 7716]|nr:Glycosyl transferase, family 2 [Calothrix sp. PCC 7716]
MSTISVIIAAYNAEKTILETIESVQKQTFTDFELIIINDGSCDKTVEIINSVNDPRIKLFSYSNGGVSISRNRGISHATAEYIAFLDADDLWTEDKLELLLAALQKNPQAGLAYSWASYMDEDGTSIKPAPPVYLQGNVYAELLVYDFIVTGSSLIRKEAIDTVGGFDVTLKGAEDWDYWLRLALKWDFVVVPKHQLLCRQTSGSLTSKVETMEKCNLEVINRGFTAGSAKIQFLKNKSLANTYRYSAHLYLTKVGTAEAAQKALGKLLQAVILYPKIVLDVWAIKLLIKALLILVISLKVSFNILKGISESPLAPLNNRGTREFKAPLIKGGWGDSKILRITVFYMLSGLWTN